MGLKGNYFGRNCVFLHPVISKNRMNWKNWRISREGYFDGLVIIAGFKSTCLSSPQLLSILKNETIQNCHPGGTVTELAYAYDGVTSSCFPTMIYVCLDYPNEPYRIRILGRPLIFESQTHCENECLHGERWCQDMSPTPSYLRSPLSVCLSVCPVSTCPSSQWFLSTQPQNSSLTNTTTWSLLPFFGWSCCYLCILNSLSSTAIRTNATKMPHSTVLEVNAYVGVAILVIDLTFSAYMTYEEN